MRKSALRCLLYLCFGWLLFLSFPGDLSAGKEPEPIRVQWSDDWRQMKFVFQGESCCWPDDLENGGYRPPDQPPVFEVEKKWPVVALRTRWSISLKHLPPKYRSEMRDLLLMLSCDAELYEYMYPQIIRSSAYRCPREFIAKANNPFGYDLAEAMRGKLVAYRITANAGWGAPDYTIETRMRIGVSGDKRTIFYHDSPTSITAHLKVRDYLAAFRVTDEALYCEGRMLCVGSSRFFFRGEHLRRTALSGQYIAERMYQDLLETRTDERIDEYLDAVKNHYINLAQLVQRFKTDEAKVLP